MWRLFLAIVLTLSAGAALADNTAAPSSPAVALPPGTTAISPAEFGAYATGKTLAYAENGAVWGRETYLKGRKVMWRAEGKDCKVGHWWADKGAVCFGYDDGTTDQCWVFARGPHGLRAIFLGKPDAPAASVREVKGPVPCPGPAVGS